MSQTFLHVMVVTTHGHVWVSVWVTTTINNICGDSKSLNTCFNLKEIKNTYMGNIQTRCRVSRNTSNRNLLQVNEIRHLWLRRFLTFSQSHTVVFVLIKEDASSYFIIIFAILLTQTLFHLSLLDVLRSGIYIHIFGQFIEPHTVNVLRKKKVGDIRMLRKINKII